MDDFQFVKAERGQQLARLAITGPSSSGKTLGALLIAKGLDCKKIGMIDTEHAEANLYANAFDFHILNFKPPYSVERYIKAIQTGVEQGFDCIIIDSLSHSWMGEGGLLEFNDKVSKAKYKSNSFAAWSETTPKYRNLVEAIRRCPVHIICTLRSKIVYSLGDEGERRVSKLGVGIEHRSNTEYEFTVIIDVNEDHIARVTKGRGLNWNDEPFVITEKTGEELKAWLFEGKVPGDELFSDFFWSIYEVSKFGKEIIKALTKVCLLLDVELEDDFGEIVQPDKVQKYVRKCIIDKANELGGLGKCKYIAQAAIKFLNFKVGTDMDTLEEECINLCPDSFIVWLNNRYSSYQAEHASTSVDSPAEEDNKHITPKEWEDE